MEQKEFIFPKHVHDQWESISVLQINYSHKRNFNLASNFQLTFLFFFLSIFKYLRDLSFQKFLS